MILWNMYQKGNVKALETLLVYNAEETVVLQHLLMSAMEFEFSKRPELNLKPISLPPVPKIPGAIDKEVLEKLQRYFTRPLFE